MIDLRKLALDSIDEHLARERADASPVATISFITALSLVAVFAFFMIGTAPGG